jgi:hypothetical protein
MKNVKIKAYEEFIESCGENEPGYEKSWFAGWDAAEKYFENRIKELEEFEWKYKELCK